MLICHSDLRRRGYGFTISKRGKYIHRKMERTNVWKTNVCHTRQVTLSDTKNYLCFSCLLGRSPPIEFLLGIYISLRKEENPSTCSTEKICINRLLMSLVRLPVNSSLSRVKFLGVCFHSTYAGIRDMHRLA